MKYADGALTEDEYADMKAKRQTWRDNINAYEAEIASLEAADTTETEAAETETETSAES